MSSKLSTSNIATKRAANIKIFPRGKEIGQLTEQKRYLQKIADLFWTFHPEVHPAQSSFVERPIIFRMGCRLEISLAPRSQIDHASR
jgi:hypothetical protein